MNDAMPDRRSSWTDRTAYLGIAAVSAAVLGFLLWLIYLRPPVSEPPAWSASLPAANAIFNALSATCLVFAVLAILRGHKSLHITLVLTALFWSTVFLASYILHHAFHGDTKFGGEGPIRGLYFFILISHVLLSMAIVPMILTTVFFAVTGRFQRHRKLARITFPAWLYVSVTGVLIFLLLKANE